MSGNYDSIEDLPRYHRADAERVGLNQTLRDANHEAATILDLIDLEKRMEDALGNERVFMRRQFDDREADPRDWSVTRRTLHPNLEDELDRTDKVSVCAAVASGLSLILGLVALLLAIFL
ncbi:hypothetical protein Q7C18_02685 [Nesterenkonia sp. CL21]|uniref:hypothetical protein n=1 Tax=Nesterenkonia sp. CL21 TaxID=3064894 RepID=UPI00287AF5F2|nr:hypothetical protein [Nesterenkonia sp. CL21]MDS2171595.1 hypothetical protein [Nesterenkonia sp. CL21]